jgi:hypothetical protein
MLPEIFRSDIFFGFIVGSVLGSIATWRFYERTKNDSVGRKIENIMLSKNVEEMLVLCQELNNVIEKIETESVELYDQIYRVRDIESLPEDYVHTKGSLDEKAPILDLELDLDEENNHKE